MEQTKQSKKKSTAPKKKNGPRKKDQKRVAMPVSIGTRIGGSPPKIAMTNGRDGKIVVTQREFVGDVVSTTTFAVQSMAINPGLASTFPWLSQLSRLYEFYHFTSLEFEFRSTCATSVGGMLGMAVDYDAFDYIANNKAEFMQNYGHVRSNLWDKCSLKCDTANLNRFARQRYTRAGELAANLDVKMYDICRFIFAAHAPSLLAGTAVGELYINYTVELMTPQPAYWPLDDPTAISAKIQSSANIALANIIQDAVKSGGLDCEVVANGLRFNRTGQFLFEAKTTGTGINNGDPAINVVSGSATVNPFADTIINTGATLAITVLTAVIATAPTVLSFAYTGRASTVSDFVLRVAPYKRTL